MNDENNQILTEKYNELSTRNASQEEIDSVMGELCHELEFEEQSQQQAEDEARFETYLESLPDDTHTP